MLLFFFVFLSENYKYGLIYIPIPMPKKTVSMTLDEDTLSKFQEFCSSRGMKVSSKIEIMMKEVLSKNPTGFSRGSVKEELKNARQKG